MDFLAKNIKKLRRINNFTQSELSERLKVKRSKIGAIEEGRSEPRASLLLKIATLFQKSIEEIITKDLSQVDTNELNINTGLDEEGKKIRHHKVVVFEKDLDREIISLVPITARAGYTSGIYNLSYIEELPKFNLPFNEISRFGAYRVFQIAGDSMEPKVNPGDYLITEYVDNWRSTKNEHRYIIITSSDGILYKKIVRDKNTIKMISDNLAYEPFEINIGEIVEIWKPVGLITFQINF